MSFFSREEMREDLLMTDNHVLHLQNRAACRWDVSRSFGVGWGCIDRVEGYSENKRKGTTVMACSYLCVYITGLSMFWR